MTEEIKLRRREAAAAITGGFCVRVCTSRPSSTHIGMIFFMRAHTLRCFQDYFSLRSRRCVFISASAKMDAARFSTRPHAHSQFVHIFARPCSCLSKDPLVRTRVRSHVRESQPSLRRVSCVRVCVFQQQPVVFCQNTVMYTPSMYTQHLLPTDSCVHVHEMYTSVSLRFLKL